MQRGRCTIYRRGAVEAERVEHRGDRGREVEAGDTGPHRQRDPPVGGGEQLVAEPVALGAEGEDGARVDRGRVDLLPLRVEREQRPPRPPAGAALDATAATAGSA